MREKQLSDIYIYVYIYVYTYVNFEICFWLFFDGSRALLVLLPFGLFFGHADTPRAELVKWQRE